MADLTDNERKQFFEKGIVRIKRFAPNKKVEAAKAAILTELDRLKLREKGRPATSKLEHLPVFQQIGVLGQKIKVGSTVHELFSEDLTQLIDSLAGARATAAAPHPQLLISFPHKETWTLSGLNWHLDLTPSVKDEITGIQAFVLIDTVLPHGGATLAIAGSHRLHYLKSKSAHSVLREDEVLSSLFTASRRTNEELLQPRNIGRIDVSIVEMSGAAGDLYLMDMRVLHSPSINATKAIRMMATSRYMIQPAY